MGRNRQSALDSWMPPRVYRGKSAYELRIKDGRCIRLADLKASKPQVIRRYDEEVKKLEVRSGSFEQLVTEYLSSPEYRRLALKTRKEYSNYARYLIPVFGKMARGRITPVHIRTYMNLRSERSESCANREHAFMSTVFSWGIQRKPDIKENPCKYVNKFTEKPRTRYITDAEYLAVIDQANPLMHAAMEISYCCAARQGDVLQIRRQDLRDEGLYIKQNKTGKEQIKRWTPRLRKAIDLALNQQGDIKSAIWIFINQNSTNNTIGKRTFYSWFIRAKKKAQAANPGMKFDFTFHDIKAKSISDYEGNKQDFSGHLNPAQVATYDRKIKVVDSHE